MLRLTFLTPGIHASAAADPLALCPSPHPLGEKLCRRGRVGITVAPLHHCSPGWPSASRSLLLLPPNPFSAAGGSTPYRDGHPPYSFLLLRLGCSAFQGPRGKRGKEEGKTALLSLQLFTTRRSFPQTSGPQGSSARPAGRDPGWVATPFLFPLNPAYPRTTPPHPLFPLDL